MLGELSQRKEYNSGGPTVPVSWKRFEYDGLNLLRADALYDNDSNGLEENDGWRRVEVNTHRPGALGALVGKRVYTYASATSGTPSGSNDYTYAYDAVGNTVAVYNANASGRGNELYYFSQDTFGNELSDDPSLPASQRTNVLGGSRWSDARPPTPRLRRRSSCLIVCSLKF